MLYRAVIERLADSAGMKYLRRFRVFRLNPTPMYAKQYYSPCTDSHPHHKADVLVDTVGGDDGKLVMLYAQDGVARKARAGEWRGYATKNNEDVVSEIYIKRDGTIELVGLKENKEKAKITIKADSKSIEINGTEFSGLIKIVELTAKLNQLVSELQAHTHGGSTPVQTFTPFVKEEYENANVQHGGGF